MFLILLGAPGAGKGTQAEMICSHYKMPHVSTGDIFRAIIKKNTEQSVVIAGYIDEGNLVPCEIVIQLVKDRLDYPDCKSGAVIDGFPRTLNQAMLMGQISGGLGQGIKVLNFVVERDILTERVLGRRVCSDCARIYSHKDLGRKKCDCGGGLYSRGDDNAHSFRTRLKVYDEWTAPLIDYYNQKNSLISIDGSGTADAVFKTVMAELDKIGIRA